MANSRVKRERREERQRRKESKKKRFRVVIRWTSPWPNGWRGSEQVVSGFDSMWQGVSYAVNYRNQLFSTVHILDVKEDRSFHIRTTTDTLREFRMRRRISRRKQEVRVNWLKEGF